MINLVGYAPLLDYRYWANPRPVPLGPSLVGSFVFFFGWFVVASAVLYVAAHVIRKEDKLKAKMVLRFAEVLMRVGLLGYLMLFFAYEQLPILGMRFWALLWLALFIYWMARAVGYAVKEYPARKSRIEKFKELRKYFPGGSK